jgi:flavin reductase (DIM6/NTAB) family NADH-FMN oxidoreductase RutF
MTACHEARRAGVLVETVQVCGEDPPLLCVTLRKGHWIEPIIRDSHAFAICLLDPTDRLTPRKFVEPGRTREMGDPFDCLACERLQTGAPIIRRAIAAFDCLVARHLDIENEYGLFIGTVVASVVYQPISQGAALPMIQVDQPPGRPSMTG